MIYTPTYNKDLIIDLCAICGVEFDMKRGARSCKCNECKDKNLCCLCEKEYLTKEMIKDDNGDLKCQDCVIPKCRYCKSKVQRGLNYCDKHCADGWWYATYRYCKNE